MIKGDKSLEEEVMDLLDSGKISPEAAVKMLKGNSPTHPNQKPSQPIIQTQTPTKNKKGFKIWPLVVLPLGILGYWWYTSSFPNINNQGRQTEIYQQSQQVQTPVQNYDNTNQIQQAEQPQEETVKRDTVGLNMWANSNKLNYFFGVTGKKVFEFCMYDLYASHNSNMKNAEWMRDEYDKVLLLEVKALGKSGETTVYPLSFSLQTSIDYTSSLLYGKNNDADAKAIIEILKEKGYNITSTGLSTDRYNEVKFYLPFLIQNKTTLKYNQQAVPAELLYLANDEDEGQSIISIGKPED